MPLSHNEALAAGFAIKQTVTITTSTTSGQIVSVQNPEGAPVIVKRAFLVVRTGSSAACTLDVGTATTSTSTDNLIDGISVNAAANTIYDNITNKGSNGKERQLLGATDYYTATVASGDANGLVADFYLDCGLTSGGP